MEKIICPDCGKTFNAHTPAAAACPYCDPKKMSTQTEVSDTDYQYLSRRDYSAPENYPGY